MTWYNLFQATAHNPQSVAIFMAQVWQAIAQSNNLALMSNFAINLNTPLSIAQALDFAGVPLPSSAWSSYGGLR